MKCVRIAMTAAVALTIAGCGDSATSDPAPSADGATDAGLVHVHGLGVNPADGALFIATHTGVWRLPDGANKASRVANRFQDTMGFAVVGPNRFIGSGHPDLTEKLPPFLGFVESTDAARSWRKVSLLGEADFHVLEGSGRRVYGFGSDFDSSSEQLLVSGDRGRSWTSREFPESFISLAIDPRDPDTALASGQQSLHLTTDGGRSWAEVEGSPGLLTWTGDGVFRIDGRGAVAKASAPGSSWSEIGDIGGAPAAFDSGDDALFVALHDSTIKQSRDGEDWIVRYVP